jgi:hypothetical protein
MKEIKTTVESDVKTMKTQLTDLAIRLAFWMVLITFIIAIALPLLGDTIGNLYLDFRDYFKDAPTGEKAGLTFFGLF